MDYRRCSAARANRRSAAVAAGNVSGPRRIMAGACRDSLIGVRIVNGRGEIVKSGGRVMKNVTGLDLVKLVRRLLGHAGRVQRSRSSRCCPRPRRRRRWCCTGSTTPGRSPRMAAGLGSPFEVTGAAHLPSDIERVPEDAPAARGLRASVAYRPVSCERCWRGFGAADVIEGETSRRGFGAMSATRPSWPSRAMAPSGASRSRPPRPPRLVGMLAGLRLPRHLLIGAAGSSGLPRRQPETPGAGAARAALRRHGRHATLVRAPAEVRARRAGVRAPAGARCMPMTAGHQGELRSGRASSIPAACTRAFESRWSRHHRCRPISRPSSSKIPAMQEFGEDPAHLRALRILHGDLPDLPAARRRARQPARAHLPDQGHAGERQAGHAAKS